MRRCTGKTQCGGRCHRLCNSKRCWQHGGGSQITFHCYIVLDAEQHYSRDTQQLTDHFNTRGFDLTKPKKKHITLLDFDITIDDRAIQNLSKNHPNKYKIQHLAPNNQVDMRSFGRFRKNLFDDIQRISTQSINAYFQGYPADTTASLYPSKYDKKGPYLAAVFRTDLAFVHLLIPAIKQNVRSLIEGSGGKMTISQFFNDPKNIILHMSLGKENIPNTPVNQQAITSDIAKNYAISPNIFARNHNLLYVEGTSNVILS